MGTNLRASLQEPVHKLTGNQSDDGDSLMFGCKTLIRQHKIGNKRVKDYIRVYEASTLWKKYGLDSDGLVLFALLSGGDYNTAGLRGCGPKTAHRLAMTYPELSQDLRNTTKILLPQWRMQLQSMLLELRSDIDVPANFPEWRPLDYYRNPTVSANGQLLKLRGLRQDWDRSVKQAELRIFLQKHFNFTTREFLKHIAPIFVISRLARVMPDQRVSNIELGIELKRSRKRKDETDNVDDRTEAKVKFSPLSVVDIDLSQCPVEEDWTGFAAKDGTPYDPVQKVECEILHCFLKNGLPEGALEYATPAKRKRKEQELQSSSTSTPTKRRKTASVDSDPGAQVVSSTVDEGTLARDGRNATSKKRGRPRKDPSDPAKNKNSAITKAKDSRGDVPDDPPLAVFRQPRALLDLRDSMIGSRAADEVSAASLRVTERLYSVPEPPLVMPNSSHSTNQNQSENSIPRLVPGETIPPETLRQIRATAFLAKGSSSCSPQQSSKLNFPKPALAPLKHYEVIDLT